MPIFTRPHGMVWDRPLFGGRLRAAVPVTIPVRPHPDDVEPFDYELEVTIDVVGERLQCTELRVKRLPGGPPVTTENLRRIPVAALVSFAAVRVDVVVEMQPDPDEPGGYREVPYNPPPADFAAAGMTTEALHHAAYVYRWAVATGGKPFGVLQREYNLPRGKASRWITTARRRGILEPLEGDDDDV